MNFFFSFLLFSFLFLFLFLFFFSFLFFFFPFVSFPSFLFSDLTKFQFPLRHLAIAILRKYCNTMNIANVLPIDLQAGHSVLTGQSWYARNPEDLKEIPAFSEEQFFQVSAIFQEIWGLGPKTSIPSLVHQEVQKTSFSTLNTFNPLALQRLEGKVDTLLKTMENSNKMKNPIPFPLSIEQVYMTENLSQPDFLSKPTHRKWNTQRSI